MEKREKIHIFSTFFSSSLATEYSRAVSETAAQRVKAIHRRLRQADLQGAPEYATECLAGLLVRPCSAQ